MGSVGHKKQSNPKFCPSKMLVLVLCMARDSQYSNCNTIMGSEVLTAPLQPIKTMLIHTMTTVSQTTVKKKVHSPTSLILTMITSRQTALPLATHQHSNMAGHMFLLSTGSLGAELGQLSCHFTLLLFFVFNFRFFAMSRLYLSVV